MFIVKACMKAAVVTAAAAAILLNAGTAFATIDTCQKKLEKIAAKVASTVLKAQNKCKDAARKQSCTAAQCTALGVPCSCCEGAALGPDCEADLEGAADTCEKALLKVYQLGVDGDPAKAYNKLEASIAKLRVPGELVCTDADLEQLGHLKSGVNAPGTGDDFLVTWLGLAKELVAVKEEVWEVGDTRELLDTVLGVSDCALPGIDRPNLCNLSEKNWPKCHTHACALSAGSGAALQPLGLPVGLSGRRIALEICQTPATGLPLDSNTKIVINQPARTLQPPPVIPIAPAITVCVSQIRSEGWCDCAGAGAGYEPSFCLDHMANAGGTCPATGATAEDGCVCLAGAPGMPCTTAGCLACGTSTGAPCHANTSNSAVTKSWAGASGVGDCVDLNTIQFQLSPNGICTDGMSAIGQCGVFGPAPDVGCTMIGGVACLDARGADATFCTADDLLAANAPTAVPFTTGSSTSTIEDSVAGTGACAGGTTPGMGCIESANCGGGGVCVGATFGCGTGPNAEDCQHTAGPGAGIACTAYESSNIAGWSIVGSFPALDGAGGIGDAVTVFTLTCN